MLPVSSENPRNPRGQRPSAREGGVTDEGNLSTRAVSTLSTIPPSPLLLSKYYRDHQCYSSTYRPSRSGVSASPTTGSDWALRAPVITGPSASPAGVYWSLSALRRPRPLFIPCRPSSEIQPTSNLPQVSFISSHSLPPPATLALPPLITTTTSLLLLLLTLKTSTLLALSPPPSPSESDPPNARKNISWPLRIYSRLLNYIAGSPSRIVSVNGPGSICLLIDFAVGCRGSSVA